MHWRATLGCKKDHCSLPGKQEGIKTLTRTRALVSVCWTSLQTRTRNQEAPRRNRHQLGPRKAAQNCARLRYKLFRSNRLKGKGPQTYGSRVGALPVLPWVLPGSWVGAHLDHIAQGGSMNVASVANLGWLTTTWAADLGSEDTTRPEKPELCVRPGLLSIGAGLVTPAAQHP